MLEQSQYGLKVSELHERLGGVASERTIFRDIQDLQNAGFPLTQKEEGRWWLPSGEGIGNVPVHASEFLSLLLALDLFEIYRCSDAAEGLVSLRDKVAAMLSIPASQVSQERRPSLVGSFTAPGLFTAEDERIEAIEEAIRRKHRLEIRYRSAGRDETTRRVDPYSMWFADGRLYLIGWCHLRSDFRTFQASRILEAVVLGESYQRDTSFDVRAFVGAGFGVWSGKQHDVELIFASDVAHVPMERRLHETQQCLPLEDGRVALRMRVGGIPQLATWLAGFGGLVWIERPRFLREMVRQIHERGLRAHCSEEQLIETIAS